MRGLGGYKAVSEALTGALAEDVPYPTVASWAVNGIPVRVWTEFIAFAKDAGVTVTADELLRTRPRRTKIERRIRRKHSRAGIAASHGVAS
jgi:hypothetical protein